MVLAVAVATTSLVKCPQLNSFSSALKAPWQGEVTFPPARPSGWPSVDAPDALDGRGSGRKRGGRPSAAPGGSLRGFPPRLVPCIAP